MGKAVRSRPGRGRSRARVGLRDPGLMRRRTVLREGQPKQAKRCLPRHAIALEQHGTEQSLRLRLAFSCRQPQPLRRLAWVSPGAVTVEIKPAEIVLSIG